jgi:alpha-glucosidase
VSDVARVYLFVRPATARAGAAGDGAPSVPPMAAPWWQTATVYQIYPRSFLDTSGNGVGDLEGVRRRLDHLAWLGVDAIWLSPFFPSPMADFGYDVADFCDVDPVFGTLDDFDRLLADAHERGIRVVIDWVPNHTSDQHPWFVESRASRDSSKRGWYVWRDGEPDQPPNGWRAAFTGESTWVRDDDGQLRPRVIDLPVDVASSAWTWDDATRQWYLHLFLPEQPDLEWRNPEVVAAMHDTLRFWLDRGVDGFRADVIHAVGKDPDAPDPAAEQGELASLPESDTSEWEQTHEILRGLRRLLDSYDGDRMMVGEVFLLDTAKVARYYGDGDELHLCFNFPPLFTRWAAPRWRRRVVDVETHVGEVGGWPTWVLSNHDNPRHRSRYGTEARARAAAVLLLGLRGTTFLYAGEELGLEDAEVPPEQVVDPGGRDGCRAPIPWERDGRHGWAADPWLPWPPQAAARSLEAARADGSSTLHLYRRLLAARRASPALQLGSLDLLDAPETVLAWRRRHEGDERVVVVGFRDDDVVVDGLDGDWTVEVASDGVGEGAFWRGRLGPDQAVVLRPSQPRP